MNNFEKQSKFEIRPIMEQKPFESPAVQAFFKKWCEINDSLEPRIVDRVEYERKGAKGILEKRPDGKQNLYIPDNLQLWEMVGIMEAIDKDTFKKKPEIWQKKREEILELGKTFRDAGAYIAKRLDYIGQGKEIAGALAEEFYNYGESLIHKKKAKKEIGVRDAARRGLSPERTADIDRWLAGEELYESRRKRALRRGSGQADKADSRKMDKFYEKERQKTLAQFFRVAQKAFELQQKQGEKLSPEAAGSRLKPWQSDALFHSAFLRKIERAMQKKIETPKIELEDSIFRRGMELLQKNMPFDKLPNWVKDCYLHWQGGEKTLREALRIDSLKLQLKMAREFGTPAEISERERYVADKIQLAVSQFKYKSLANNPSEMIASQHLNCVGFSMLGGALMQEARLDYLLGAVPRHSVLFLVTSDGHVEWRDMQNSSHNEDLTDEMIRGKKKDGSPLKVADIVAFSKKPKPEGLRFDISGKEYRKKLSWFREGQGQYVTMFEPEYGQKIQVLNNAGNAFADLGRDEEAIIAYRQVIALDPKYHYAYRNMGTSLSSLNRNEEAIEAYRQAIAIYPDFAESYFSMGISLSALGRNEEAINAYQKFIKLSEKSELNPDHVVVLVKEAENRIEELKNKL